MGFYRTTPPSGHNLTTMRRLLRIWMVGAEDAGEVRLVVMRVVVVVVEEEEHRKVVQLRYSSRAEVRVTTKGVCYSGYCQCFGHGHAWVGECDS